jgi:hypothetical protein
MNKYILMSVTVLQACAPVSGASASSANPSASSGWVGVGILMGSGEELHLFNNPQTVGQFPGHCTTVAVRSDGERKELVSYYGKMVTVRGRAILWPGGNTISITIGQSTIRNICNSNIVVVADDIKPKPTGLR